MSATCVATSAASPRDLKTLSWSADGTSVVVLTGNDDIETFVVPQDLLDEKPEPHVLSPYCTISSPTPVRAVTSYPGFNLQESSACIVLSATRDHPVRLHSALTADLLASYPLINPLTEEYLVPYALTFTGDGTRFVAGSDTLISVFDLSRPGQEPLASFPTGPKRRRQTNIFNPNTSIRGIVSSLAIDTTSNLLAAGALTREIALYANQGSGECIGAFSLQNNLADGQIGGQGVTSLAWSSCGRYLYVAERKSDGIMVYDIRMTGQLLSWCQGREAGTHLRLGIHIDAAAEPGERVWAGGADGKVRMWPSPHLQTGAQDPILELPAYQDAVTSCEVHRTGGVLATSAHQIYGASNHNATLKKQLHLGAESSLKIFSLDDA